MEDIKVLVTKREGRKFLMAYYIDPITGKQKFRSTKTTVKRDADKFAGKWEDELRNGRYKSPSKITWEEFTDRFILEYCSGLAENTRSKYNTAFTQFQKHTNVTRLQEVDASLVSIFVTGYRATDSEESTLASRLRHLKAAFRWAQSLGLMNEAPSIKMPKRAKGQTLMKGRPLTMEELERMIAKVPQVCGDDVAHGWTRLLWGLWYSGLRLSESVNLYWDGWKGIVVQLDTRRPMLMIPADAEKGNKDRLLPITPDFARFLQETPVEQRTGRVFQVLTKTGRPTTNVPTIGKRIADIGTEAGVKVKDDNGKLKFASAHDLRRAFGQRWSRKVMPAVLMELMRHDSINTTMKFYVGTQAECIADQLWEAEEMNSSMNTEQKASAKPEPDSTEAHDQQ